MIQDIFIDIGSSGVVSYEMPYKSYYYKNKLTICINKNRIRIFWNKKRAIP